MSRPPLDIPDPIRVALASARVARMAVIDEFGVPSMAPVCYVLEGQALFLVKDDFPQDVGMLREQQVAALGANPNMAVLVDHWEENWNQNGMVLLRGVGEVLPAPGTEQRRALSVLRDKYAQYRGVNLKDEPVIRLDILSLRSWGVLEGLTPGVSTA